NGCWLAKCQDGRKVGPGEDCDDGNKINGDGCTSKCKIEKGWYCDEADLTTMKSTCVTHCGDAMMVASQEDCDDGNLDNLDGCDGTCAVEPGYFCYGGSIDNPSKCTCEPINATVTFTDNWEGLIITYPYPIDFVNPNPSIANPSSDMCLELFAQDTIQKLG